MSSAPSGTVTFLFTDIEGSTRRWERAGDAMAAALERHDAAVREELAKRRGHIFKTVGDAFCCAFRNVDDAVEAAVAIQLALAREDFRSVGGLWVRIAIHTGSASERAGDYFGPTVNRVARLLAIAHGGQVLLSGTAAELFSEKHGEDTTLVDLGEHYLKDLGRPERVHQIEAPGLRTTFPPLRSVGVIPNNIPAFSSTFVGRSREVAQIGSRLATARGMTLCGTGGIGKTRCALEVGKDRITEFRQGVWFVELSSITSGEQVAGAIAAALGMAEPAGTDILSAVCARLKMHSALIVLDTCEHLVEDVSSVAETILQTCANVRIIATSREPLGYRGESTYRIPSLETPPTSLRLTAEAALGYDAVALFVTRANEVDPNFSLTDDNLASVVAICRRLDGIALAIELAAIRLRAISLPQLETGLRARFKLLTGGLRTALPRQKTMRAVLDWSFELLDERERKLFCGLAVFADGFTLEACEVVCADAVDAKHEILDLLTSLVDKSLVSGPSAAAGDDRFRLIETLREYAAEKLFERGEGAARYEALASWAFERAEAAHAQWVTTATDAWEARFKPEVGNVRAAVEWALGSGADATLGARIAARARRMFGASAPAQGQRLIQLALATGAWPAEVKAELTLGFAQTSIALRRPALALESARVAFAAFIALGLEEFAREAQIVAGYALALLGRAGEAKLELRAAQAYFEAANLVQFCGVIATDLGVAHNLMEEYDEARTAYDRALEAFRRTRNSRGIRAVVTNLAELDFKAGHVDDAIDRLSAELAGADGGDPIMLSNLSAYLIAAKRFGGALEYARESLIASQGSGHEVDTLLSLQHVAAAMVLAPGDAAAREDWPRIAAALVGYVDARLATIAFAREYTERQEYDTLLFTLKQRFGEQLENVMLEGARLDDRKAVDIALRT